MVARSSLGRYARQAYVSSTRATRRGLDRTGLLHRLESHVTPGRFSWATHARSMLSIYDAADLARWDLPWWTYPAARSVEEYLTAKQGRARVFEYGAGASTVWLRARADEVISVEHDEEFLPVLGPLLDDTSADGRVLLRPLRSDGQTAEGDRYVGSIDEFDGEFDLVVVDGRERARCVHAALPRLAEGGLILLDDSQRRRYRPALTIPGTVVTEYRGLVPTLPIPRRTAIIRRTG